MIRLLVLIVLVYSAEFSPIYSQLLWKISGKGLDKPSWLFGTIHVVPAEKFIVWPTVDSAFRSSNLLVMEMDLDLSASEKLQAARQMALPEGNTLENYLPADNFVKLRTYCTDTLKWKKRKFNRYIRMKPFYFSSIVLGEQLGKVVGYEQYFAKQAKRRNMQVRGLETMQQQLDAVNAVSVEEQASMLTESMHAGKKEFEAMLEVYLNRDIETLGVLMAEEGARIDGFTSALLTSRNQNWIDILEKWLYEESAFIAVGAGHLPGNVGLIQLLRNRGFTLEPIW